MIKEYRQKREIDMQREKTDNSWLNYNLRYIKTYKKILQDKFRSKILDVGCGSGHLVRACRIKGYDTEGIDIDQCNFETDSLPYKDKTFNLIICNAVIEHISNPINIMKEMNRVLKERGILIIRTPNWQLDKNNFYNDPTHKTPYTPISLAALMKMYSFKLIFLEPGLICKSAFYWNLPNFLKWIIASWIPGGTKSILCIGKKYKNNFQKLDRNKLCGLGNK